MASLSLGCREVCANCTTHFSNTHKTGERQVLYGYHPWAGRVASIDRIIERSGIAVARCQLSGTAAGLPLELPLWMFDGPACSAVRFLEHPQVDLAALSALQCLLTDIAGANGGRAAVSSTSPELRADWLSGDQNQGDDHAPISHEFSPVGSVWSTGRQPFRRNAAMAESATPDPPEGNLPGGAFAHRTLPGGTERTWRRSVRSARKRGEP